MTNSDFEPFFISYLFIILKTNSRNVSEKKNCEFGTKLRPDKTELLQIFVSTLLVVDEYFIKLCEVDMILNPAKQIHTGSNPFSYNISKTQRNILGGELGV